MKTTTIAVCHGKGGVGKTSIVLLTAGTFSAQGITTLVVDCDSQASASKWAGAAPDNKPFPVSVVNLSSFEGKVHREIQKHVGNYDIILVDCPARLESSATQSVLLVSDIALIPLPPSPTDFWATIGTRDLIERAQVINPELRAFIVQNRVTRTSLSKAIAAELRSIGIPIMDAQLRNRTAYQEAAISGATISDLGRSAKAAIAEVQALCDAVLLLVGERT